MNLVLFLQLFHAAADVLDRAVLYGDLQLHAAVEAALQRLPKQLVEQREQACGFRSVRRSVGRSCRGVDHDSQCTDFSAELQATFGRPRFS